MTTAVILAGGLGTRLRSVVTDLPKPMAPLNGRPFLEYLMQYWADQGISRFLLSVGYHHEKISNHFGDRFSGLPVDYVVEDQPLGTGGGLLLALDALAREKRALLLNGDTYFAVDLDLLSQLAESEDADWCFSLYRDSDTDRYMGMRLNDQGRIIKLRDESPGPDCLVNGGVYLFKPSALEGRYPAGSTLSLEDDIFTDALDSGQRLYGLQCEGTFIDIGIPADYHRAAKILVK